jgi:hypothetical protein
MRVVENNNAINLPLASLDPYQDVKFSGSFLGHSRGICRVRFLVEPHPEAEASCATTHCAFTCHFSRYHPSALFPIVLMAEREHGLLLSLFKVPSR